MTLTIFPNLINLTMYSTAHTSITDLLSELAEEIAFPVIPYEDVQVSRAVKFTLEFDKYEDLVSTLNFMTFFQCDFRIKSRYVMGWVKLEVIVFPLDRPNPNP